MATPAAVSAIPNDKIASPISLGKPNEQFIPKTKDITSQDFFKLLSAQLQHQDPTDPMDGTEFVSQMLTMTAHSNSLQQLNELKSIGDSIKLIKEHLMPTKDKPSLENDKTKKI